MIRRVLIIALIIALLPALVWAGKSRGGKKTGMMNIQVREVIVRSTPSYLSSKVSTVYYGDQVNVLGGDGNWHQIDSPTSGWLPKSAVTKYKVKVNPDAKYSKGTTVKHDEVALAGKGFNPQVEAAYKRGNPSLASAYAAVDSVETFGATEGELRAFRNAGKLQ